MSRGNAIIPPRREIGCDNPTRHPVSDVWCVALRLLLAHTRRSDTSWRLLRQRLHTRPA